ncbi:hypothetical protein DH2020_020314 [Rehmannia glutinosa]|uniref:Reverse transcriptase Ty1/copia-type domain-containing protein n=1 Tax=Rehmannia glutinosa TaxID=99300 RepID=A0ABR0WKI4_REHGL
MRQPIGFVDKKNHDFVCLLKKSLYGLKQSPRCWNKKFDDCMLSLKFKRSKVDRTLFRIQDGESILLVQIYVDDIIFGSTNKELCDKFSNLVQAKFELSMMGELTFFLGLLVKQMKNGTFMSQTKYTRDLMKKFEVGLSQCKPVPNPICSSTKLSLQDSAHLEDLTLYRSTIGALQYLNMTRRDISFVVNKLSQFLHAPTENHWKICKRVLRYLKGTISASILFQPISRMSLECYSDSDYAGNIDDRKSTSGSCQFLGDCLVSWFSKKQNCVSLSTAEAEYISAAFCCTQLLWMKQTLADYKCSFENVPIFCDNISAINIAQNPVHHNRTKHIEIRHHFLRDCVSKRKIEISFVPSQDQLADIFTKPLTSETFASIRARLGIMHIE